MRVVLALDKFKGTFTASQACEHLAEGIRRRNPKIEIELRPMADGGDGTAAILASALGMDAMRVQVPDLLGLPVDANIYWQNSRRIALVESASVLGISRTIAREDVLWHSSSAGLGSLVKKALDLRPSELWIAVGGTMTADAGWGLASMLGLEAKDSEGNILKPCLSNMKKIVKIEHAEQAEHVRRARISTLCDVNAPAMMSPVSLRSFLAQKGAKPESFAEIEDHIRSFWTILSTTSSRTPTLDSAFTGAGGGMLLGISSVFSSSRAELGAEKVVRATALAQALVDANLVVCGEGCLDEQSFYGKAPGVVAALAHHHGIPAMGVFGKVQGDETSLKTRLGVAEIRRLQRNDVNLANQELAKQGRIRLAEIGGEIALIVENSARKL